MDELLDVAAAARLIRLIGVDEITRPLREMIISEAYAWRGVTAPRYGDLYLTWTEYAALDRDAPRVVALLDCKWCLGVWAATIVLVIRRYKIGRALRDLLAVAYGASNLETFVKS